MTLDTAHSKEIYQGNGSTTEFPFFFKVWDAAQIAVTVTDAAGSSVDVTTQCAIALNDGGGTVTYLSAGAPLPSGSTLAITRNMPFTQGVDLVSGSQFDPQVIEDALDQATAERQQVKEMLARAVILPSTSSETPQDVVQDIYTARDDAEAAAAAAATSEAAAASSATSAAAHALLAEQSRGQACQCADRAEQARDVAMQQAETINVVMATEMGKINTAIAINKDDQAAAITASRAWSETDEDVPVDTDEQGNPEYSSKHWALKSSQLMAGDASTIRKGVMQVGSGLDVAGGLVSVKVATSTEKGIGRVATLADMELDAVVENGPAFLAAGVHTSVAAAAGKVPVADADGSMGSWANIKNAACSTAANTASKEAALSGFALVKGARVYVTFTNANTVPGALTLNVNSTGAKAIYNEFGAVSATNPATFPAGVPIEFIYDANDHWTYRKYQDEFAKTVGGAPMYACRAWAVYNGATSTILASGNISSVTRLSDGQYVFNFVQPMPDANYAISGVVNTTAGDGLARDIYITAQSANSFQAQTNDYNSNSLHDCVIEISVVR